MKIEPAAMLAEELWSEPLLLVHYGERHYEATEPHPHGDAMKSEQSL